MSNILTKDEKCTYCREYGNLPCEKCDEKLNAKISLAMEQPKKYIKVSIDERLPIPFKDVIIITDLDEWGNGYCSENNNWWLHSKSDGKVTHWLDTVPDRESELIEILEECNKFLYNFKYSSINDAYVLQSKLNTKLSHIKNGN